MSAIPPSFVWGVAFGGLVAVGTYGGEHFHGNYNYTKMLLFLSSKSNYSALGYKRCERSLWVNF